MVDAIRSWVSNIMAVIIFVSIIEILLPEGKIKKYVGLITGVLIIITIMTPIVKGINKDVTLQLPELSNTEINNENIIVQTKQLEKIQNDQIVRVYKNKIEEEIKEQLNDFNSVECRDVICRFGQTDKEFGNITEILVFLKPKSIENKSKEVKSINIQIKKEVESQNKETVKVDEKTKREITKKISTLYGISEGKIKIIEFK